MDKSLVIAQRYTKYFKDTYFPEASDNEVTDVLVKAQFVINEKVENWLEEYEDLASEFEGLEIDTTTSSDWEPHGREATQEEIEDAIIEEYGTEEEFIRDKLESPEGIFYTDLLDEPLIEKHSAEFEDMGDFDSDLFDYLYEHKMTMQEAKNIVIKKGYKVI
jgi:hypothetical protein